MGTNLLKNHTLQAALAVIGLAVAPALAFGQQAADVTVETPQIRNDDQPIGRLGALAPAFSASYRVSYADLDVATHSGATALENRVRDAAKRVCKQIEVQERASSDGDPPCVNGAVKSGMQQARAAIVAAEARAKTKVAAVAIAATDERGHD